MDEFSRIRLLLAPLVAGVPEALDLRDDAAWLQPPAGHTLIATADALVEGIHFLGHEPAHLIAQKALRVNLSDIAAMGAAPYGYLLTMQLPARCDDAWLADFTHGLAADHAAFGVRLWGGDSSRAHAHISLSITALGLLPAGVAPLRRNGARVGDDVYVSGFLGGGALGLQRLQAGAAIALSDPCISRYLRPDPRLALGQALRPLASACMDISDGLWQDTGHIAVSSGVGMLLDVAALPLPPDATADEVTMHAALSGGDDYELLFTAPPEHRAAMAALAEQLGVPITRVGEVTPHGEKGVQLILPHGMQPPPRKGWVHGA